MIDTSKIAEHMEVVGSDGLHVGTVDHMDGNRIKLTKTDSDDGVHHYLDVDMVENVDDVVTLTLPAEQVKMTWDVM